MTPDDWQQEIVNTAHRVQIALQKLVESIDKYEQAQSARDKHPVVHANIGLPVEVSEYYRAEQDERRENTLRERIRVGLEILGILVAFALAIFTLYSVIVLRGQLWQMQEQTRYARRTAHQASQDSIDTANRSNKQLAVDQRAWVGAIQIDGLPQVGKLWGPVIVQVRNVGKTPALHTTVDVCYKPVPKNMTFVFDCKEKPGGTMATMLPTVTIYPAAPIPFNRSVNQNDWNLIISADVRAYVYGIIHYDDIFQHSHWMRFCFFLNPNPMGWAGYSKYNDTDTDLE